MAPASTWGSIAKSSDGWPVAMEAGHQGGGDLNGQLTATAESTGMEGPEGVSFFKAAQSQIW